MFYVLCFMFYVLCFMFYVLCFMFCKKIEIVIINIINIVPITSNIMKKIFYLNDNENEPITAGGIMPYRIKKGDVQLMVKNDNGTLNDFGGKIIATDNTIIDTISRKARDESNNLFDKNKLQLQLQLQLQSQSHAYIPHSKYVIYTINIVDIVNSIDTIDTIMNDNCDIKWISLHMFLKPEIIKHKINIRLRHTSFFDILKNIERNMLEWNLFKML